MGQAFAESATLTRGLRWKLAGVLIGVSLLSPALGFVAAVLGGACTSVVLGLTGSDATSLAVSFGVLLLLRTIVGAVCTFLGSCVDAGVFTSLYRQRRASVGGETSLRTQPGPIGPPPRVGLQRRWSWAC